MSKFLGILVLLALGYGIYALVNHYQAIESDPNAGSVQPTMVMTDDGTMAPAPVPGEEVATDSLAGLPPNFDKTLKAAYEKGAPGLGAWLKLYRAYVKDPRRAGIELDYCVLLTRTDPEQAKALFAAVKKRVTPDSPLYPRVKRLAPNFE
jgi:hypothetical protein